MKLFMNHLPKTIGKSKQYGNRTPHSCSFLVKDEAKIAGANVGNKCPTVECMLTPLANS
jgi:hypothetical protein